VRAAGTAAARWWPEGLGSGSRPAYAAPAPSRRVPPRPRARDGSTRCGIGWLIYLSENETQQQHQHAHPPSYPPGDDGGGSSSRSVNSSSPSHVPHTNHDSRCSTWMVKRSEIVSFGGLWLEGHGLSEGSETPSLSS